MFVWTVNIPYDAKSSKTIKAFEENLTPEEECLTVDKSMSKNTVILRHFSFNPVC